MRDRELPINLLTIKNMIFSKGAKKYALITGAVSVVAIALVASYSLFIYPVSAASKPCGDHKGINCSAGGAFDGAVVCNDGTTDASAMYSAQAVCKKATLRCPIVLTKDAYDKQKKVFDEAIKSLQDSNKKICTSAFVVLEDINTQLYNDCKKSSDASSCDKNKKDTASYNKNNLDICLHASDDAVAKYQEQSACLMVSGAKVAGYGTVGYALPSYHPAYFASCSLYGPVAALNKDNNRCYCPENWEWSKSGKLCVQSPPCPQGSGRVNGACVTYTKSCINKLGASAFSVTLPNRTRECRCGTGYKMNPEKTKCVSG
jgi:hypothetical protein